MKESKKLNIKVAVAMSGGVDSSVAAALMCEKYGQENVFGITAKLFCYKEADARRQAQGATSEKACCSSDAINDAKSVCAKLGIPHYVVSEEKEFEQAVIKDFIEAYRHGQTPIPCVPCNSIIKFGTMLKKVKKLGADKLVTGHYARIKREIPNIKSQKTNITQNSKLKTQNLSHRLLKGIDNNKDQTYFLYGLSQEQLSQIEFPIGELTKPGVRKIAKDLEIKTAEKRESQGVCFVSEGRVTDYLADKIESNPGRIVDTRGKEIGQHQGYIFYTIGQRKMIGGGHKEPMFVVKINPIENEVVIGTKDELYKKELTFRPTNWVNPIDFPLNCTAKIRYNMNDAECIVKHQASNTKYEDNFAGTRNLPEMHSGKAGSKLKTQNYAVVFEKPQRAITPGQSVVFYDRDICLGGGIIIE
jgi:tRNA-uridine 2-sulfurtransferase